MFKVFLKQLSILMVLCGMGLSTSLAEDFRPETIEAATLDLDDPRLELWYGTELDPLRLPGIVWMDGDLPLVESKTEVSNNLNPSSHKLSHSKFKLSKKSTEFFDGEEVASSLAFAEPFDFNTWVLVKWTVVVLILAGIATFIFRGKHVRLPISPATRDMKLIESLSVDQRARLHLVAVGGERFLIATDLTGLKSTTLIPNWNLDTEQIDAEINTVEAMNQSTAISISEAS